VAEGRVSGPNNARLKKLLAESMLDVSTLREMLAKNF
jgi:putative transposase